MGKYRKLSEEHLALIREHIGNDVNEPMTFRQIGLMIGFNQNVIKRHAIKMGLVEGICYEEYLRECRAKRKLSSMNIDGFEEIKKAYHNRYYKTNPEYAEKQRERSRKRYYRLKEERNNGIVR